MSILMTSEQVSKSIQDKIPTGTQLNSEQIAQQWDDSARARAMFSARVARADILAGFQRRIQQVVDGKLSENSARVWMRKLIESKGDSVMAEMGFKGVKEGAAGDVTELASDVRLNLIIDTNVSIAHATSRYQKVQDIKQVYPYVRYRSKDDGRTRPAHRALNGKVFRTDSPEAALLWPPNGFRCRCEMIPINKQELQGDEVQDSIPAEYLEKRAADKDTFTFDPRKSYPSALTPRDTWTPDARKIYVEGTLADIDVEIDHFTKQRKVWLEHAAKAKKPSEIARGLEAANDMEQRLKDLAIERRKVEDFGKQPPPPPVPVPVPTPPPTPVPIIQPVPPVTPVPVVPAPVPTPIKIKLTPEQKLEQTINVDLPKKLNEIEDKYVKAEEKAKVNLKLQIDKLESVMDEKRQKGEKYLPIAIQQDEIRVKLQNLPRQIAETKIRLSEKAVLRSMAPHIGDVKKLNEITAKWDEVYKQISDLDEERRKSLGKTTLQEGKEYRAKRNELVARLNQISKDKNPLQTAIDKARMVLNKRLLSVFGDEIPLGMTVDIQEQTLKKSPYNANIVDGVNGVAKVFKTSTLAGKSVPIANAVMYDNGRAYYQLGKIHLSENSSDINVVHHEMGHLVEDLVEAINNNSVEYLKYRAKKAGVKASTMVLIGQDKNKVDMYEWYYIGAFPNRYTGKDYTKGGQDSVNISEVFSMGVESFMKDMLAFAINDPGHFAFIIRQILIARRS